MGKVIIAMAKRAWYGNQAFILRDALIHWTAHDIIIQ